MAENLSESNVESRWDALLKASKRVLDAFTSGHHPTQYALDRLAGAIAGIETLKTCGHRLIEDCNCEESR